MRDPARIDAILEMVRTLWRNYPDLRLTQLIVNLIPRSGWSCPEVFSFEDDKLAERLKAAIEQIPQAASDEPHHAS